MNLTSAGVPDKYDTHLFTDKRFWGIIFAAVAPISKKGRLNSSYGLAYGAIRVINGDSVVYTLYGFYDLSAFGSRHKYVSLFPH